MSDKLSEPQKAALLMVRDATLASENAPGSEAEALSRNIIEAIDIALSLERGVAGLVPEGWKLYRVAYAEHDDPTQAWWVILEREGPADSINLLASVTATGPTIEAAIQAAAERVTK